MIAKGARSMKSKLMSVCHLFTYANFEYYERNGMKWLSGGSITDNFFGLNTDIRGFALAAYIVQLAAEITGEGIGAERTLRMTLNSLYAIENKLKPLEQIKSAYEIFAAEESGFAPDLSECLRCNSEDVESSWLDVMNGGLVCEACMRARGGAERVAAEGVDATMTSTILVPMSAPAIAAWRYVAAAPLKRILAFKIEGDERSTLARASETYIINHLERNFETLEFYHSIKE
jgi:DNA repair protein RecO (recombination protein O)